MVNNEVNPAQRKFTIGKHHGRGWRGDNKLEENAKKVMAEQNERGSLRILRRDLDTWEF